MRVFAFFHPSNLGARRCKKYKQVIELIAQEIQRRDSDDDLNFPQVTPLDHLGSPPSSGRFCQWHASLCWTLAVRLAGCDAHFDGVSAIEARELLDEPTWDWNNMISQGPRWSTSAGQEAIRAFFWARASGPAPLRQWEYTPPPSPSPSISSSSGVVDLVPDNEGQHAERENSVRIKFIWPICLSIPGTINEPTTMPKPRV
ncbi:hypothetical protein GGX14DRAFT_546077 [Mycena pura]|uniref:Uncharacterized protein n=1 Tax=Mycena pura TaxID=153505 RepID=A0AAD6V0S5_9AGAR|nr:hypothetical protein GGX14DRAFT_546077 [Mycena pura]